MYKIFIVEDDRTIADSIVEQLKVWQYEGYVVRDFSNVLQECTDYKPDLILMDIGLPYYDGYYWCSEIRKISDVPIIFISSMSENMNVLMAINMGGDDFVAKPFDMQILIAKIQALLRRTYDYHGDSEVIEHHGLRLNIATNEAVYMDQSIDLTKNEYRILLELIQSKGKIVSREKLMNALWKTDVYIDENTLTVNINRLRKKLESYGIKDFIETKVGVGYIVL